MSTVKAYLTPASLQNLSSYKYSSIDISLVAQYILQPYWRWATTLLPPDLAPNSITSIGFGCIVFNLACVWIFDPSLGSEGRKAGGWLYLS